jgi:ABC-type polysaccharide/polyol phosphate export permease
MVKRDFQQRYVGSVVGWLWGLIHPLVLLASYTFVFSYCLKQRGNADQAQGHYWLFLFAGMLPWMLFSETIARGSSSLLDQSNLITKTVFPAEIVPISIFLSTLVGHLLAIFLLFTSVLLVLHQAGFSLILLPVLFLLTGLLAVGLAWISSSLQVYLRDTAQVVTVILTFWLWLTPIFIPDQQYPAKARFVLVLNPITYLVHCYRDVLLSSRFPAFHDLAILASVSVAVFVAGGLFFRHMKRGFADVL